MSKPEEVEPEEVAPIPVTTYVGSYYSPSGFNLAITPNTEEVILVDLDNATAWLDPLLQYASKKNHGVASNRTSVVVGFCGISFEYSLKKNEQFIQMIRMDTPTKEATDHAISFYAGKVSFYMIVHWDSIAVVVQVYLITW
jgi:hypothetical protein